LICPLRIIHRGHLKHKTGNVCCTTAFVAGPTYGLIPRAPALCLVVSHRQFNPMTATGRNRMIVTPTGTSAAHPIADLQKILCTVSACAIAIAKVCVADTSHRTAGRPALGHERGRPQRRRASVGTNGPTHRNRAGTGRAQRTAPDHAGTRNDCGAPCDRGVNVQSGMGREDGRTAVSDLRPGRSRNYICRKRWT